MPCLTAIERGVQRKKRSNVLADQKNIHLAEVKIVEEGKSCVSVFRRVHSRIKLYQEAILAIYSFIELRRHRPYHDGLPLVLDDMAGSSDFISTPEIREE